MLQPTSANGSAAAIHKFTRGIPLTAGEETEPVYADKKRLIITEVPGQEPKRPHDLEMHPAPDERPQFSFAPSRIRVSSKAVLDGDGLRRNFGDPTRAVCFFKSRIVNRKFEDAQTH
ncbi:MAG: hypothetical protein WBN22_01550 [Verrucomicrobiia bacterium]